MKSKNGDEKEIATDAKTIKAVEQQVYNNIRIPRRSICRRQISVSRLRVPHCAKEQKTL